MVLFALDPWWNDFYAIAGFYIGIVGSIIGVGGFWIAIWQIRKTKRSVDAARDAATQTMADNRNSYQRFVGDYGSRLLNELEDAVHRPNWDHVEVRLRDLADLLGTIAASRRLGEKVSELREARQIVAARKEGKKPTFTQQKWNALLLQVYAEFDLLRMPFQERNHDEGELDIAAREPAPQAGPGPSRQDETRSSELGLE